VIYTSLYLEDKIDTTKTLEADFFQRTRFNSRTMEESSDNNENEEKSVLSSEIIEYNKGNDDSYVEANKEHSTQLPVQKQISDLLFTLLTEQRNEIASLKKSIYDLQQNSASTGTLVELQQNQTQLMSDIEELKTQVTELKDCLAGVTEAHENDSATIEELQSKVAVNSATLAELETSQTELAVCVESLKISQSEASESIDTLREDMISVKESIEELRMLNLNKVNGVTGEITLIPQALGMQDGSIKDSQITSTSSISARCLPSYARLDLKYTDRHAGGWRPSDEDVDRWKYLDVKIIFYC